MKLYRIWILVLLVAAVYVLTLLYGPTAKAQEMSAESAQAKSTQAGKAISANTAKPADKSEVAEDVSWDDGAAPGPANLKQSPKEGNRSPKGTRPVPRTNRPDRDRFDGRPVPPPDDMPPSDMPPSDMRPSDMDRPMPPPMDGPDSDFNPRPAGMPPQGPGRQHNRNDVMPPPPTGPFQNWEELEKADPEFFNMLKKDAQLERQTRQLTMQYRQATDDKAKEEIGKKLAQTVAEHFDVRQKRRAMELERLEKELNRLKTLFEKRNQSRDKIIEDRVKELRGDEESLF